MDQIDALQKKRLFNSVITAVILLSVFLGVKTLNSLKESSYIGRGTYAANVITVSGTGEVLAVPDIGSFSFSVVEDGKTVSEAQGKATKKVNTIIDALKAQGIAEKDIKTDSYNSYPRYDYTSQPMCANGYCPPTKQVLSGYEVSQTVSVKIRKTADAGAVLTKVGDLGASNLSGLNFVVDDMTSVQAEARDKAIADAKEKAKVLAKSLGVSLNKIVNFSEGGVSPIYYAMDSKAMSGSVSVQSAMPPQLPTGENKVTSNVSITYEIK